VYKILLTILILALPLVPAGASAFDLEESLKELHEQYRAQEHSVTPAAKGGGMTLNEAIERCRRRGDVERIISAETRREGNRQVHVIKYLTKDNKVRTAKYDGPRD
jgi:hypothetical protein